MVKKLLKQEYNYYIRTLIFILPATILLAIFLRIMRTIDLNSKIYDIFFGGTLAIFIVSSVAAILVANLLGIVRFYKNMYSSEGYLTFSLPVSNHQHVISKLIAYLLAIIITTVIVIVAWLIVYLGFEELKEFIIDIGILFKELANFVFKESGGISFIFMLLELLIILFLSFILKPIQYYAFISIGQTAKKNRILLAIGAGYLYTVILQVLSTVALMIIAFLSPTFDFIGDFVINHPMAFIHVCLWIIILIYGLLNVLFYTVNIKIMNKKLNIE